jgi:hypothetical protein
MNPRLCLRSALWFQKQNEWTCWNSGQIQDRCIAPKTWPGWRIYRRHPFRIWTNRHILSTSPRKPLLRITYLALHSAMGGWSYNTPDNLVNDGLQLTVIAITLTTLSLAAVLLRFYVRAYMIRATGAGRGFVLHYSFSLTNDLHLIRRLGLDSHMGM